MPPIVHTRVRAQESKSLELRAVINAARLQQQCSRITDAYKQLSGIYAWFIDGFDTPDSVVAKELLVAFN